MNGPGRRPAAARNRLLRIRLAADHVDVQVLAALQNLVNDGAAQQIPPARAQRLAGHNLGHVAAEGVLDHRLRHRIAAQPDRLRAQPFGQAQGLRHARLFCFRKVAGPRRFHVGGDPFRVQPAGQPAGRAHQSLAQRAGADADQQTLAGRPGAGNGVRLHVGAHLLVHPIRRPAQRHLAQGGQVAWAKELAQRPLRLGRHINLTRLQPGQQLIDRQVNQLDFVRFVKHPVGHRLLHRHARDLRDHVVEALQMLDIHRRVDVDAAIQQFQDILVAPAMARAGRVSVRQFVYQGDLRPAAEHRVGVHLAQSGAAIGDCLPGDDLQAGEQSVGLRPAVCLHVGDDHVHPVHAELLGGGQHRVGLAHARRIAEHNLQLAAGVLGVLPLNLVQELVGIGSCVHS